MSFLPKYIRRDRDIRPASKVLYAELWSLSKAGSEEIHCYNSELASIFNVRENTVCEWVKDLKDKGYIAVTYKNGSQRNPRTIKVLSAGEIA